MPEPRFRLRLKRIDRVAFVDKGDNPKADVLIWKRAPDAPEPAESMLTKVLDAIKALGRTPQDAGDENMSKPFDPTSLSPEAKAAFDELTKRATDAEAALKARAPETPKEPELPAGVAKRVEEAEKRAKDAEERVAKIELANRTAEFVKRAESYTHLPIKAAEFGPILRKVADGEKLTEAEGKELDRVLSAANETARVGGIFAEVGADGDGEGTATQKVAKLAAEAKKADPKLSDVQARAQVYKSNPGLMAEVEAEDAERAKARR